MLRESLRLRYQPDVLANAEMEPYRGFLGTGDKSSCPVRSTGPNKPCERRACTGWSPCLPVCRWSTCKSCSPRSPHQGVVVGFLLVVPTEIRSGLGLAQARQLGPAHDGLAKAGRHHDVRIVSMGYKAPVQPYMDPLFKLILPAHYRLVCSWNIWGLAICQSLFECP